MLNRSASFFWKVSGHFKHKKHNLLDPKDISKKTIWSCGNFFNLHGPIFLSKYLYFFVFYPIFDKNRTLDGREVAATSNFFSRMSFGSKRLGFLCLKCPDNFQKKLADIFLHHDENYHFSKDFATPALDSPSKWQFWTPIFKIEFFYDYYLSHNDTWVEVSVIVDA